MAHATCRLCDQPATRHVISLHGTFNVCEDHYAALLVRRNAKGGTAPLAIIGSVLLAPVLVYLTNQPLLGLLPVLVAAVAIMAGNLATTNRLL